MPASKPLILFLLFVFVSVLVQGTVYDHGLEVGKITSALSSKGFVAMSLILEQTLTTLVPLELGHNNTLTLFCPRDEAFFSPKYPQPPLTLLQYNVMPLTLDREALKSSLKVNTLLPGHPLVVTTLPRSRRASINDVKITFWDIYNDGCVIVHGVEDFFDPAFQTLLYQWYDDRFTKDEGKSSSSRNNIVETAQGVSVLSWVKENFLVLFIIAFNGLYLAIICLLKCNRRYSEYVYLRSDGSVLA